MTEEDIVKIETVLGLTLPADYRDHLAKNDLDEEEHGILDDVTALRDADAIIEATQQYRAGFSGLPPWPPNWLYMGDESDACPYALDCLDGRLLRLDKGHPKRPPLEEFASFAAFFERCRQSREGEEPQTDEPMTRREKLQGWLYLLGVLLAIFVVMPAVLFTLNLLYRYLVYGEVPLYEPGR